MTSTPSDKAQTKPAEIEDITMPSLGADMTEGTLTEWLVQEGDQVTSGDIIAVLETQKGAIDMEVYSSGTIAEILVSPVAEVPVGTVLARITLAEPSKNRSEQIPVLSSIPAVIANATTSEPPIEMEKSIDVSKLAKVNDIKVTDAKASPIARRLAKEQQLNLSGIKGSGPQGAILLNDLSHLLKTEINIKNDNHKSADKTEQNMRNAIAVAMTKSKQEIPHFYLSLELELNNAQQWLQQRNQATSPEKKVLLLALLLKALAKSLVKYPKINGFYQSAFYQDSTFEKKSAFEQASAIHIGNVISLRQGGLVVPAIHDVDKLSVTELMRGLRDITDRSRNGHLRSSELMDATITVTNMGERGADSVFGIIYPPQVAILGFGKVRKIVKVVNDNVVIASVLTASLSADHRVIDGMLAAKFLNYLAKQLQKPERL
ncbi:MAG: pyruvate dehydrogenase E2 component (dihydrolipoamide acetyltransferase) [Colwellia sp.]|jgi:pyruvate dehydrogenase E2 component (dihydrolipoamide acetyltransferase)